MNTFNQDHLAAIVATGCNPAYATQHYRSHTYALESGLMAVYYLPSLSDINFLPLSPGDVVVVPSVAAAHQATDLPNEVIALEDLKDFLYHRNYGEACTEYRSLMKRCNQAWAALKTTFVAHDAASEESDAATAAFDTYEIPRFRAVTTA